MAALAALAFSGVAVLAGDLKEELRLDPPNLHLLDTRFSTYGHNPPRSVHREAAGLRFWLPGGSKAVPQTGVYSYFALAGDFEIVATYELLNLPTPQTGYGSGVGLAADAGDAVGRVSIQRVVKLPEGNGYSLNRTLTGPREKNEDTYRFVASAAKKGRIGLKRIKKEVLFLTADSPTAPLQEIERLPFTEGTIRQVRFFADPGDSTTAVDVRLSGIEIRAEEMAGGVPQREQRGFKGWWVAGVLLAVGFGLLFGWRWQTRRGQAATRQG